MKRITSVGVVLAAALVLGSCGGNSTLDDTEAVVYITVDIEEYNPDIDICAYHRRRGRHRHRDDERDIQRRKRRGRPWAARRTCGFSAGSSPPSAMTAAPRLRPRRSSTRASSSPPAGPPIWTNWRVYPVEYLNEIPLAYLLPENGGVDPETGNRNIRQRLVLQMFGETMSGKSVASIPQPIQFNFFCGSP